MNFKAWRLAVILAAGAAAGILWGVSSGRGFALDGNAFLREGEDIEVIEAPEAKKRLDQGALFLDARPVAFYRMSHIPGALPLPEDDFEGAFPSVEKTLRGRFDLVVYCSGFGCEASHIVARRLRERGIPAAILHDGWPAWTDAGYPVREGAEP
jgi:rhodanese-related sulfurtransferase